MTFENATTQIISMLETANPVASSGSGLALELIHLRTFDPGIPETYPLESFRFALLASRAAVDMRAKHASARQGFADVVLSVFFGGGVDRRTQDLDIWETAYPLIREALFSPATWDRPASGIISLEPSSFEGFQAEAPVVSPDGARILSVLLALRYTNQTA